MKILIISTAFAPYVNGVATFTNNLGHQLSQKHSVVIISSTANKNMLKKQLNPNLSLFLLPGITFKKRNNLAISYPHQKKIDTIINQFKPDIIHLQDFGPISLSAIRISHKLKIPTVITHHFTAELVLKHLIPNFKASNRLSQAKISQQIIYRLVNLFYNPCSLVTTPNPTLIPLLKKAKLKSPIISIPNGIVSKNFSYKTKLKTLQAKFQLSGSKIILYVGRLDLDKNVELIIKAYQAIQAHNQDTCLVIVGEGKEKSDLIKLAKDLKIKQRVHFLGQIDNNDKTLSHLYHAAYLFAHASIIENQSLTFIEALTAGLPIVTTNIPSQNKFIKHQVNGLLYEPNHQAALAVCLQQLLSSSKLRKTISRNNLKIAKKYDISNIARLYLQAYQSLL